MAGKKLRTGKIYYRLKERADQSLLLILFANTTNLELTAQQAAGAAVRHLCTGV